MTFSDLAVEPGAGDAVPASAPVKVTTLVASKPEPEIVSVDPIGPEPGLNPVIRASTAKLSSLIVVPAGVVTEIGPLAAVDGTVAEMSAPPASLKVAGTDGGPPAKPLNLTEVTPNSGSMLIATTSPGAPCTGSKYMMRGLMASFAVVVNEPPNVVMVSGAVTAPDGTTNDM